VEHREFRVVGRQLARGIGLATVALLVAAAPAFASSATFVRDIKPGPPDGMFPPDSHPHGFADLGGTAMFFADDGVHGFELWRSDGTAAGTDMVRDIYPGIEDSVPFLADSPVAVRGKIYFAANDGVHGINLWRSDGTRAGTRLVRAVTPGAFSPSPESLVRFGGKVYFTDDDGEHGVELWRSDGTAAGTRLVRDINPGPDWSYISELTAVGDTLYFDALDGVHGVELWRSDGTSRGTKMVRDIRPNAGRWSSGSHPSDLTRVGQVLFFIANDGTHGWELWRSDGTARGTRLVRDIWPGEHGLLGSTDITGVAGVAFLRAGDGTHGEELWRSDGTPGGTRLVRDINPGSASSLPYQLEKSGGTLFFAADDGTHGDELWRSDGTKIGTKLVRNIRGGSLPSYPDTLTNVGGTLFFDATDGIHGYELWSSDGTFEGTTLLDIRPDANEGGYGDRGSVPSSLTEIGGTLFFGANDGTHGIEPWRAVP
jgi:ELWxxDGT repeat protein